VRGLSWESGQYSNMPVQDYDCAPSLGILDMAERERMALRLRPAQRDVGEVGGRPRLILEAQDQLHRSADFSTGMVARSTARVSRSWLVVLSSFRT